MPANYAVSVVDAVAVGEDLGMGADAGVARLMLARNCPS